MPPVMRLTAENTAVPANVVAHELRAMRLQVSLPRARLLDALVRRMPDENRTPGDSRTARER